MSLLDSSLQKIKSVFGERFFKQGHFGNFILGNTSPVTINTRDAWIVYRENPHLRLVINEKSKMFSNVRLEVVDVLTQQRVVDHPASQLLMDPNPLQSQNQWMWQYSFYKDLWANAFIFKLSGGVGDVPQVLWNLPPSEMEVVPTGKLFQQSDITKIIKNYRFSETSIIFEVEDIIHQSVNDSPEYLIGENRLETLKLPLSNIQGALKTRNILIHEKGAIGMLSNDNKDNSGGIPLQDGERKRIEKEYRTKYGIGDDQMKVLITNASLKWNPMSYPTKDLMLFEEIEDDFNTICGSYGMDRDLFPSTKGATFENKKQAEKRTYQSTIQPEADSLAQALTTHFGLLNEGLMIVATLTHLPVMQEDQLQAAQVDKQVTDKISIWLKDGIITKEQYASIVGIEFSSSDDDKSLQDKIRNAQVDLRGTVGGVNGLLGINAAVASGQLDKATAVQILVNIYGFDFSTANSMITIATLPAPS